MNIHLNKKRLNYNFSKALSCNNAGKLTLNRHRIITPFKNTKLVDLWFAYYGRKASKAMLIKKIWIFKHKYYIPIGLIIYLNGEYTGALRYIPWTKDIHIGSVINFFNTSKLLVGNSYYLKDLPIGSYIHNVELQPLKGSAIAKSIGTYAQLIGFTNNKALIKLPSTEIRLISFNCCCFLGINSTEINLISKVSKAGSLSLLGKRPIVRGVAKNAVDHPHGGGEGKGRIGRAFLCTPYGKLAKGKLTRNIKSRKGNYIIKRKYI